MNRKSPEDRTTGVASTEAPLCTKTQRYMYIKCKQPDNQNEGTVTNRTKSKFVKSSLNMLFSNVQITPILNKLKEHVT